MNRKSLKVMAERTASTSIRYTGSCFFLPLFVVYATDEGPKPCKMRIFTG